MGLCRRWFGLRFMLLLTALLMRCSAINGSNSQLAQSGSADVKWENVRPPSNIWTHYTKSAKPGDSRTRSAAVCNDEYSCLALSLSETERQALEAIRTLHGQLDDDANGNIDLSESDEFLRQELHYEGGHERRQKAFHRDDDMHISVRELWEIWIRSEVHNWTADQTTDWLVHFVQLPQYVPNFQIHGINGTTLPRLAITNVHYISSVLGIKDPIHRQKIAVKAMDVVLFGPPKDSSSHVKDMTLVALLVAALAGAWYTYRTDRNSKQHLSKLMEHMEILSSAEKELQELQVKLQHARQEQDITLSEKIQLERQLEQGTGAVVQANDLATCPLPDPLAEVEIRRLRDEVEILRGELLRAEGELEDRLCWAPPPDLQHWLQLTYELEQRVYNKKRLHAEKQLEQAKDACEKLNRKRSSFVASFVSTHGRTIDDVDKSILEARSSLMEVKQDLQERTTRWRQIESLCGFPIATNPGLSYLETLLRNGLSSSRYVLMNSVIRHLVSTSALLFLTSAAGPPVAASAAALPYSQQPEGRNGNRGLPMHPKKYPLPKRDSSISLESNSSTVSSNGNGSSRSISLSELPRASGASGRQKLNQRENSKDSAFDGSTVSGMGDDETPSEPKFNGNVSHHLVRSGPTTGSKSGHPLVRSDPNDSHGSKTVLDRPTSLTVGSNNEGGRRSPSLPPKSNFRPHHPMNKAQSHESPDVTSSFKPILRKISQSESALDVSFQSALQAEESGQEEAVSTDSSIPSTDDAARKMKKKRFHFPSFVKRSKNKT